MIRGLYTAASGMDAEMMRQDVLANNLANGTTTGFKKDEAVQTSFPNMLISRMDDRLRAEPFFTLNPNVQGNPGSPPLGALTQGVMSTAVETNFEDGSVKRTDNPMDLAIKGNAMFMVEMPDGSIAYTRNGSMKLNEQGELVSLGGHVMLSKRGDAIVPGDGDMKVLPNGRVVVNGEEVDQLATVTYDKGADLRKFGEGLWLSDTGQGVYEDNPDNKFEITQGFLEGSNVSVIEEMVNMITVTRSYEANQKSVQAQDDTLDKLINQMSRFS